MMRLEAVLQMILQGSARVELKIGGITEHVNAGNERVRRIAQIDERPQFWKKKLDVLVNAGNDRMEQLEEDIAQINEKIRDLIDVLTVQVQPEDSGVSFVVTLRWKTSAKNQTKRKGKGPMSIRTLTVVGSVFIPS